MKHQIEPLRRSVMFVTKDYKKRAIKNILNNKNVYKTYYK